MILKHQEPKEKKLTNIFKSGDWILSGMNYDLTNTGEPG